MTSRFFQVWVVALAGALLLAGCRTASREVSGGGAARESEAAVKRRAAAHAHYAQAVVLELSGQALEALEEYDQAAALDPANEELVVDVARRWLLLQKPERALTILKLGVAEPGSTALLDALLGTAYAQSGKTNLAVAANERAIKKAPLLLAGYQNLYVGLLQSGQTAAALKVLDRASKQQGADAEFLIGLAEFYENLAVKVPSEKTNALPKALQLLNRAETLDIPDIHTRVRLADGFNVVGESEKAAQLYQALLTDYPQAPMLQETLRAKLTDLYLRGKDPQRAVEQLEVIVRGDPMNVQAHYYLALLYTEASKPAQAGEHLRKVIVLNPKFEQAYYDLAMAQMRTDQTNEVLATLEAAQKKFGQNFISEFLLAVAYSQAGKADDSVKRFNSAEIIARATDPKRLTPMFYHQYGAVLERKGDYSESVKYLQKALELDPNFAEAANHLGYMWAERGENLERAKELIDRAVKDDPKNDAYLDSLAWVLFKLGRAREALPPMLQAVEIAEQEKHLDATLYDHLGDIYFALGEHANACMAWGKALKLGPNEEIQKKLDRANTN